MTKWRICCFLFHSYAEHSTVPYTENYTEEYTEHCSEEYTEGYTEHLSCKILLLNEIPWQENALKCKVL